MNNWNKGYIVCDICIDISCYDCLEYSDIKENTQQSAGANDKKWEIMESGDCEKHSKYDDFGCSGCNKCIVPNRTIFTESANIKPQYTLEHQEMLEALEYDFIENGIINFKGKE